MNCSGNSAHAHDAAFYLLGQSNRVAVSEIISGSAHFGHKAPITRGGGGGGGERV